MTKKAFGALAAVVLMTSVVPVAHGSDADVLREMKDRIEIEALMWRYVRALDTLDAKGYAQVFTEDGEFASGRTSVRGRAALEKMIEDLQRGRAEREAKGEPKSPPMYHTIANHYIEFLDRDRARMHAYWMTVFGAAAQDSPPRVAAVGRSIDELVRVDGRWLIRLRNVAPQD